MAMSADFGECLTQGFRELVGAGCAFAAAVDAFEACDSVGRLHASDERRDALQVAVTAACEQYVADCAVFKNFEIDFAAASA